MCYVSEVVLQTWFVTFITCIFMRSFARAMCQKLFCRHGLSRLSRAFLCGLLPVLCVRSCSADIVCHVYHVHFYAVSCLSDVSEVVLLSCFLNISHVHLFELSFSYAMGKKLFCRRALCKLFTFIFFPLSISCMLGKKLFC